MKQSSKQITTLLLALVLAVGVMPVAALAAPPDPGSTAVGKISDFNSGNVLENARVRVSGMADGDAEVSVGELGSLELRPGAEIQIFLTADMFLWEAPHEENSDSVDVKVTYAQLQRARIGVRRGVGRGSDVVDSIEIARDSAAGAHIKIEMVEQFVSVSEKDVDFNIYLSKNGQRNAEAVVDVAGTMENEMVEVGEGDDYVDTSDGTVIHAQDHIRSIEINAGDGLYINASLFDGRKYYAKSDQDRDAADDEVLTRYPEIDTVYTLYTVNLNSAHTEVTIDSNETCFVYDEDGTLLGTTGESLPLSGKYYLATEPIDWTGDEADAPL